MRKLWAFGGAYLVFFFAGLLGLMWLPRATRMKLMSAPITQPPNPVGTPRMLFEYETALILPQGNPFSFAASPDGQRFVVNGFATPARPVLR